MRRQQQIGLMLATAVLAGLGFLAARSAGASLARTGAVTVPTYVPSPATVVVPPAPAPRRQLLLLGDSLMYGGALADDVSPPALVARAEPQLDVVQMATGGTAIADQLTRLRPIQLLRPDIIVVWLGSEELSLGASPAGYQQSLERLITALPAVPLMLVTPIGLVDQPPQTVAVYAAVARVEASAHRLPIVDLTASIHPRDYLSDGKHLTAAADARISGLIVAALAPLVG